MATTNPFPVGFAAEMRPRVPLIILVCATLFSSHPARAQFSQQGPKLMGTGTVQSTNARVVPRKDAGSSQADRKQDETLHVNLWD
jgi:hypothetical protein